MTKTDMIRARVEPKLKNDAETILESLGLTASDAIRVFYKRIVSCKGLPFDMLVPNAETRKALLSTRKTHGAAQRLKMRRTCARSWGINALGTDLSSRCRRSLSFPNGNARRSIRVTITPPATASDSPAWLAWPLSLASPYRLA